MDGAGAKERPGQLTFCGAAGRTAAEDLPALTDLTLSGHATVVHWARKKERLGRHACWQGPDRTAAEDPKEGVLQKAILNQYVGFGKCPRAHSVRSFHSRNA